MTSHAHFPRRYQGAFTLVEMLVVVTLVTVLAGILFAAAHRGVRQAEMVESTSNLRQLAIANGNYVSDHGTYAPATDQRNRIRWHGSRQDSKSRFQPKGGYLSPYLGESEKIGTCPALRRDLKGGSSWEDGSGGYGYNAVYIGGSPAEPFTPVRPSQVRNPAGTLMFATTAFSKSSGLQEYPFAEPRFWVDPNGNPGGSLQPSVHFRFDGKALIAWCDGRVSAVSMESTSKENYYGGNNEADGIGFPGPKDDNGWWNPNR